MSKQSLSKTVYQKLLDDIAGIYDKALKEAGIAVEDILKNARREMGRLIVEVEQKGEIRAEYGSHLLENISNDLTKTGRKGFSVTNLRNMRLVYQAFPIHQISDELTWSHFVTLSSIKDSKQRLTYQKKSIQKKWIVEDLQEALKKDGIELLSTADHSKSLPAPKDAKTVRLPVKRGVVGLYPVVDFGDEKGPDLQLDMGFKNYQDIPRAFQGKVKPGDILQKGVSSLLLRKDTKKGPDPFSKSLLYTYAAKLDRVIDGDTPKVVIELGFGFRTRKKLRLRKINCPEIDTVKGQEAKAYVERVLRSVSCLVVKTYSTDIYDRYLVDVFYLTGCDDPEIIARDGILLNQELIDHGFADLWLTIEPDKLAFMK